MLFNFIFVSVSKVLILSCLPPARFKKMAGGIVLGSVAEDGDILPYISVAIKASFLEVNVQNMQKQ